MEDLDAIKAFADMEGYKSWFGHTECVFIEISGLMGKTCTKFNPLTNYSLTFKAMVKYDVDIDRHFNVVSISKPPYAAVRFTDSKEIPKAIIECILKSEGLWVA